jgi:hypothetical protein
MTCMKDDLSAVRDCGIYIFFGWAEVAGGCSGEIAGGRWVTLLKALGKWECKIRKWPNRCGCIEKGVIVGPLEGWSLFLALYYYYKLLDASTYRGSSP